MTARLEVDLTAFDANLAAARATIGPAELMVVVKDDAYRHGLEMICRRAWRDGVRWFGAFDVQNAAGVRAALGADARIFVWRAGTTSEIDDAVRQNLDIGVGDAAVLEDVAAAARTRGMRARVHLKIDSGLHRNGVRPENWSAFVDRAAELEVRGDITVAGVWSHIAEASDAEDDEARSVFDEAVDAARRAGLMPSVLHLAASAAAFARPEFRYDMVRIGAFCYGIRSAGGISEESLGVRPIASLRAPVHAVDHTVGVVRIGVGALDGLPSSLSGNMRVQTASGPRTVTAIGDQETTVEAWPDAVVGQMVTVYGSGASSATDLAEAIGTIGEEIALRVAPRVTRVYLDESGTTR
ncbi:MAG: alanine racemase [Actinobacteria bacterium]|nr:alanine racemase [Actinomycetota bacterium]